MRRISPVDSIQNDLIIWEALRWSDENTGLIRVQLMNIMYKYYSTARFCHTVAPASNVPFTSAIAAGTTGQGFLIAS